LFLFLSKITQLSHRYFFGCSTLSGYEAAFTDKQTVKHKIFLDAFLAMTCIYKQQLNFITAYNGVYSCQSLRILRIFL